jgi:hypothetical protein
VDKILHIASKVRIAYGLFYCNQKAEVRRKWQIGMHRKWQQECTGVVNI